ncbi:MAG: tRNA preQ1(34) S-adenosylmethionine ribosyltransferase-isomerase QueA [Clostridiales bacterium GWF2_36_10]|nr:MAG: tRNA preQ1(34) S-adenosylmethionine ribosyltransferase-isomerase QueA [Clostridiales bacterium GWF2_36_10]HAN21523.1 tRNA preQ1(34) S-adenosylmethionine ribosyltransferase-isomerase QueA [Clostridiales bacterium]
MQKSSYYYELPERLIAQTPLEKRDTSRLFVLHKDKENFEHKHFSDIESYLKEGDCLVINDTRVIPARIFGKSEKHSGEVETVLLKRVEKAKSELWDCLTRPGKKTKLSEKIIYPHGLTGTVTDILEGGIRRIKFEFNGIFLEILEKIGTMPLPPYITQKLTDSERYQTVYAKYNGSAAAPTAGLHFTPELLQRLPQKGVYTARVLLHVGLGTFRPVKEDDLSNHKMHSEYIKITTENANIINRCKQKGGRIFSVGTTSTRVLESVADENGVIHPFEGETDIFIYPGYKFKVVDALITNFHLPESTLIMLVSAFAGYEKTLAAYKEAVQKEYRFFSFGDAMLII